MESTDNLLVDQASVIEEAFDSVETSTHVESGSLVRSAEEVARSDLRSYQIDSKVQLVGYPKLPDTHLNSTVKTLDEWMKHDNVSAIELDKVATIRPDRNTLMK